MKKQLLFILFCTFLSITFYGQESILPIEATEFCPNTNIIFTVTLPQIQANSSINVTTNAGGCTVVAGASNISSNNGVTTFNFTGKFADNSITQSFSVSYKISTNPNAINKVFEFYKIKSVASQVLPPNHIFN